VFAECLSILSSRTDKLNQTTNISDFLASQ
jgi:hypothetical protein